MKRHDDKECSSEFERRSATFKWIVGILVVALFGLISVVYTSFHYRVAKAEDILVTKVDMPRYEKDISEIKELLKTIDRKLWDIKRQNSSQKPD